MLEAVGQRSAETGREPVLFNIEIKSAPQGDNVLHPQVTDFAQALYDVLKQYDMLERSSIQSFDPRALEAAYAIDPDVSLVLLVENNESFQHNLKRLSFKPDIYSPDYSRVDKDLVDAAHALGILVIPWTVNDEQAMRELSGLGIDGLITDYPDVAVRVLAEIKQDQ